MKHIKRFNEEIYFRGGELADKNEAKFIDALIEELNSIKSNPLSGDRLFIEELKRTYRDRYFNDEDLDNE